MIKLKKLTAVSIGFLPGLVFAQSQTEFKKYLDKSWALKNTGAVQLFDLDPLQTYRMQGRAGEDLGLLPPMASPLQPKKIIVAVVDTGVDTTHPFLKDRIAYNKSECAVLKEYQNCLTTDVKDAKVCADKYLVTGVNNSDADGNGYPADCHGWSTLTKNPTPQNIAGTPEFSDSIGHGTHVAGLIASISDQIEILPVQVISDAPNEPVKPFSIDFVPNEDGRGGISPNKSIETAENVARGIIYAMNAGAQVINLSVGWPQLFDTELMRAVISEAQARGIIIVTAAGNDSTQSLLRPCQYSNVICVAATRPDGSIAQFSNFGYGVEVAAPGASVVSVIPMDHRSIRLPGFIGIDILSGTSQASPLVAGVVADLLSRGILPEEIYARLILGARTVKKELPIIKGPITTDGTAIQPKSTYERYVLSGIVDEKGAYDVKPQTLIMTADKEIHAINWDRQSANLSFQFNIKNYWKDVAFADVSLDIKSKVQSSIYPNIESFEILNPDNDQTWEMGEERTVQVNLKITDAKDVSLSKLPSDLTFSVRSLVAGVKNMDFETRAEVMYKLEKVSAGSDLTSIPIVGKLEKGMKMFLVDEVYDDNINARDYFALKQTEKSFDVQLIRYVNNSYVFEAIKNLPFSGNINKTRPQQRIRMDIDGDGKSEYILVIQELKEKNGAYSQGDYTLHYFIFDDQLNLKKQASFYDKRALIPLQYNWLKVGNQLRPAWVGMGQGVIKQWDITDLWQTDDDAKPDLGPTDIHLYYLDADFKLATIEPDKGSRIVDIIQPSLKQVRSGVLPILIARNTGTQIKPSYINDFSIAYVQSLKVTQGKQIKNLSAATNYRNLIDTRVDKVLNLQSSADEFRGTFWFGFDSDQKQRVTMVDFVNNNIYDKLLGSMSTVYDSPLRVRSAYMGKNTQGVFIVTNTEIEYHDFKTGSAAQTSLNKYTFMGDDLTVDLQFPITISARNSKMKYPALFTTAGSGLNRGVKMLVPIFSSSGKVQELVSPARLHVQSPQGCRPMDAPLYLGANDKTGNIGGYAMDFYCGDKFLRLNLNY